MISSVSPKRRSKSKENPPSGSEVKPKISKRAQKRKAKQDALDAEEHVLESLLFGGGVGNFVSTIQERGVSGGGIEERSLDLIDDDDMEKVSKSSSDVGGEPDHIEEQSDEERFDEHGIMIDRSSSLTRSQNIGIQEEAAAVPIVKLGSTRKSVTVQADRKRTEYEATKPVWVDPDEEEDVDYSVDDKDKISLMAMQRLKKFRMSLDQTAINTKDYVHQLRTQHEYSTSVPTSWAKLDEHHAQESARKKEDDEIDQAMSASAYQLLSSSAAPLTLLGMDGVSSSTAALPAQSIRLERQPDANLMEPSNSTVQAVKFHPQQSNILFTAGLDKTLRFFQIDGTTNPKVHGIHCKPISFGTVCNGNNVNFYIASINIDMPILFSFFSGIFLTVPNLPIMSASYLGPQGTAIVLSGRRSFFYICDVVSGNITKVPGIMHRSEKSLERMITSPCGKNIVFVGNDGYAIIVDSFTRQLSSTIKMNGSCRALSYSPCGTYLFSSGSDGDVYQWDVRKNSTSIPMCVRRISNEDGTIVQSLALSDQLLAVGAESGVVNLFPSPCAAHNELNLEESSLPSSSPVTPMKRLMNLYTCASGLKFNHDGQILA